MELNKNVILLSGRPGSGKTEIMITYANVHPSTTLILSEESTKEKLIQRSLLKDVKVINMDCFHDIELTKYTTVIIDYYELFDKALISSAIEEILKLDLRLIVLTQLDRKYRVRNNPFQLSS